jgi:hypothetical protein
MTSEKDLREQLATCTRIFAMQGMIGVFGHVSVYQPDTRRVLITPGMGSDKGSLRAENMLVTDLSGKTLEGKEGPPVEWPIHTALHGARADALAASPRPERRGMRAVTAVDHYGLGDARGRRVDRRRGLVGVHAERM